VQDLLFPGREYDWIHEELEGRIGRRESVEMDLSFVGKAPKGESMEAEQSTIHTLISNEQIKTQHVKARKQMKSTMNERLEIKATQNV
jgi:hypothetical protein